MLRVFYYASNKSNTPCPFDTGTRSAVVGGREATGGGNPGKTNWQQAATAAVMTAVNPSPAIIQMKTMISCHRDPEGPPTDRLR